MKISIASAYLRCSYWDEVKARQPLVPYFNAIETTHLEINKILRVQHQNLKSQGYNFCVKIVYFPW